MKSLFITIFALAILLTVSCTITLAQAPIIPTGGEQELLLPHTTGTGAATYLASTLLPTVTKTVIGMAGALAILFLIISGVQLLTAYGNEEKIASAKKSIMVAIGGLLVALLAYSLVTIISNVQLDNPPPKQQEETKPQP